MSGWIRVWQNKAKRMSHDELGVVLYAETPVPELTGSRGTSREEQDPDHSAEDNSAKQTQFPKNALRNVAKSREMPSLRGFWQNEPTANLATYGIDGGGF
jgi:hypothetical protein